jgi:hypothetical protein
MPGWIAVFVCLIHGAIPSQSQGRVDAMEFTRLGFQVARPTFLSKGCHSMTFVSA